MSAPRGILAALARPAEACALRGAHRSVAWRELTGRAAALAARMPPPAPPANGSEVAFAFDRDRTAFVVALLATWMRGHTAVVPEDGSRECVAPLLERANHVLLVHDTGVGRGLFVPGLLPDLERAEPAGDAPFETDRPALIAVRRADVGPSVEHRWDESELVAALDRLAARLALAPGAVVASTLTPTALPGMLAGVLAPLCARAVVALDAVTPGAAEELRACAAAVLVTSAAHARVLAGLPTGSLASVRTVACVDEDPGTRTTAGLEGRHGVRASFLPDLDRDGVDGEPELLRRAVLEHEAVSDVAVLALPSVDGAPPRTLVAAVAEPAARGAVAELVESAGSARREVRFLPAIPRDANGRTIAAELLLRFGRGRAGGELVRELGWTEAGEADPAAQRFRTRLPERFAPFEGHFPGHPVLSGVAQLVELVLPCARRVRPGLGPLERLGRVKFLARLAPGDEVDVVIRAGAADGELAFAIVRGGATCSQGRLHFRADTSQGEAP